MVKIIAELGNTHEGSVGLCKAMIASAAEAGADYAKLQTHLFEYESLEDAPNPPYFDGESRKQYFERTSFSQDEYKTLFDYAEEKNIELISSVFSIEAVDLLVPLGIKILKLPSGEITNVQLLKHCALSGVPLILSSGMSNLQELDEAMETIFKFGGTVECLMQCTSAYPTPATQVGLNILSDYNTRYKNLKSVGFSDHTHGISASILSLTYGVKWIEKHFTLSREMYGSDAKNSMEPRDFRLFVDELRFAQTVLESPIEKDAIVETQANMKNVFEKSIAVLENIEVGQELNEGNIGCRKPGCGIPASEFFEIIGKRAKVHLSKNKLLRRDQFE